MDQTRRWHGDVFGYDDWIPPKAAVTRASLSARFPASFPRNGRRRQRSRCLICSIAAAGIRYSYRARMGRGNLIRSGIDDNFWGIYRSVWWQRWEVRIRDVLAYAITLPQRSVLGFRIS